MARIARIVVPGIPHHVIQRGNRRLPTFFQEDDFAFYLRLLKEFADKFHVVIHAYCLMTNHVHIIATPSSEASLRRFFGELHCRYTQHVNLREGWRGHLWQGRFLSHTMDNAHFLQAARYIERNPVKAGIVKYPEDYPWSSARGHLRMVEDELIQRECLLSMVSDWKAFIHEPTSEALCASFEKHGSTGRPLGSEEFIRALEKQTGHALFPAKPGPKPHKN